MREGRAVRSVMRSLRECEKLAGEGGERRVAAKLALRCLRGRGRGSQAAREEDREG
ncbi:hypothetical protein Pen01_26890 [Phytomonospora endophytica]|nr:hypothetical protein Pen01_26890 [Phytomonospora endophytica]